LSDPQHELTGPEPEVSASQAGPAQVGERNRHPAATQPDAPEPDPSEPVSPSNTGDALAAPAVQLSPGKTRALLPHETEGFAGAVQSLAATIAIAVFVITFIIQAFQIPSESMENTLLIGDYLLVDKTHYGPPGIWKFVMPYRPIRHGDIIVFKYPVHPSQHFVKRVIGVAGDRIRLVRRRLYINGQLQREPYVTLSDLAPEPYRDNFPNGPRESPGVEAFWYEQLQTLVDDGELIVPQGYYFVMGDNRDRSSDSRYWGFVPEENIVGRPLVIYMSLDIPEREDIAGIGTNDKISRFTFVVAHILQNIRWNRTMRIVR
jgi:signal peptidase I